MDAFECIATKLDIREFSPNEVPREIKINVLEAARLTDCTTRPWIISTQAANPRDHELASWSRSDRASLRSRLFSNSHSASIGHSITC